MAVNCPGDVQAKLGLYTEKYGHFNTFWIEMYGLHIAILVLSVVPRFQFDCVFGDPGLVCECQ